MQTESETGNTYKKRMSFTKLQTTKHSEFHDDLLISQQWQRDWCRNV